MLFNFLHFKLCLIKMRSRLSRCSTAWGSRFLINWGGPTKEGASKSFLVVESSIVVKIMNNCLILQSHYFRLVCSKSVCVVFASKRLEKDLKSIFNFPWEN